MKDYLKQLRPYNIGQTSVAIQLMNNRLGNIDLPHYYPDTVEGANDMAVGLAVRGGFPQQERMIRDKRKSLDKATLYSYQAALIRKVIPEDVELMDGQPRDLPVRALINPDKNKFDYDDKIVSTGFENDFQPGDVFEWCRTNSYWLILLQDLDEIAYFRGEIRRCDYVIDWLDEEGNKKSTFAAVRGPVETQINYIQKHQISVDVPNHSLHIYMPRNDDTMHAFRRYSKFYLAEANDPDNRICWRVEATDSISTKGILEITAEEYYANETEDNVEDGLVGAFIRKIDPNPEPQENRANIIGDTFIKPKIEYIYYAKTLDTQFRWYLANNKVPVTTESFVNEEGYPALKIKWTKSYNGQFEIWYGNEQGPFQDCTKTIVVESLF